MRINLSIAEINISDSLYLLYLFISCQSLLLCNAQGTVGLRVARRDEVCCSAGGSGQPPAGSSLPSWRQDPVAQGIPMPTSLLRFVFSL